MLLKSGVGWVYDNLPVVTALFNAEVNAEMCNKECYRLDLLHQRFEEGVGIRRGCESLASDIVRKLLGLQSC
jgi:hypothetical protein